MARSEILARGQSGSAATRGIRLVIGSVLAAWRMWRISSAWPQLITLKTDAAITQPLEVRAGEQELPVYVTRLAAASGLLCHSLDGRLEYDLRRSPDSFSCWVTNATWTNQGTCFSQPPVNTNQADDLAHWYLRNGRVQLQEVGYVDSRELLEQRQMRRSLVVTNHGRILHGRVLLTAEGVIQLDQYDSRRPMSSPVSLLRRLGDEGASVLPPWSTSRPHEHVMFVGGSTNWWHLLFDFGPKILALTEANPRGHLVISDDICGPGLEVCRALAPHATLLTQSLGDALEAQRIEAVCIVNSVPSAPWGHYPEFLRRQMQDDVSLVKERLLSYVEGDPTFASLGAEKVFLQRSKDRFRPLRNRSQVRDYLEGEGFFTVDPTDLSLGERVALLSSARLVVGEYGAGTANMLFCPPDAHLISLRGPLQAEDSSDDNLAEILAYPHTTVAGHSRPLGVGGIASDGWSAPISAIARALKT